MQSALNGLNMQAIGYGLACLFFFIFLFYLFTRHSIRNINAQGSHGVFITGDGSSVSGTTITAQKSDQQKTKPWWKTLGAFLAWMSGPTSAVIAVLTYLSDKQ